MFIGRGGIHHSHYTRVIDRQWTSASLCNFISQISASLFTLLQSYQSCIKLLPSIHCINQDKSYSLDIPRLWQWTQHFSLYGCTFPSLWLWVLEIWHIWACTNNNSLLLHLFVCFSVQLYVSRCMRVRALHLCVAVPWLYFCKYVFY